MASTEVTGASKTELRSMRSDHRDSPLFQDHGIPFETAYCLTRIGKQPDDYGGPTRYCRRRASKKDGHEDDPYVEEAYAPSCPFHGGNNGDGGNPETLEHPGLANLKHGVHAEDQHLQMDFNEQEQALYDGIVEQWPDIYGWPSEDEDPARYLILRKVATNVVRSNRAEDYLDEEGEVRRLDRFSDDGVMIEEGTDHQENPLAREYRLLVSEIQGMLSELGLTPKARQQMDTMEAKENHSDAIADIANEALNGDEHDYDPDQFSGDSE